MAMRWDPKEDHPSNSDSDSGMHVLHMSDVARAIQERVAREEQLEHEFHEHSWTVKTIQEVGTYIEGGYTVRVVRVEFIPPVKDPKAYTGPYEVDPNPPSGLDENNCAEKYLFIEPHYDQEYRCSTREDVTRIIRQLNFITSNLTKINDIRQALHETGFHHGQCCSKQARCATCEAIVMTVWAKLDPALAEYNFV